MSRVLLVLVMAVAVAYCSAASAAEAKQDVSAMAAKDGGDSTGPNEKMFFGAYRTITRTGVSLATSTVYATCLSGSDSTKLCGGRKKRNLPEASVVASEERSISLDSSQDESESEEIDETASSGKEKLLGGVYTIWTTATTSTTVTVRYTNTATTISLSYYCTAGSLEVPLFYCG